MQLYCASAKPQTCTAVIAANALADNEVIADDKGQIK